MLEHHSLSRPRQLMKHLHFSSYLLNPVTWVHPYEIFGISTSHVQQEVAPSDVPEDYGKKESKFFFLYFK